MRLWVGLLYCFCFIKSSVLSKYLSRYACMDDTPLPPLLFIHFTWVEEVYAFCTEFLFYSGTVRGMGVVSMIRC
ncbi:hypothetical protein BDD12DRAFT_163212 [Trichophaea hybrida]|nr:hypothetical protein BDD12DRAFT_163212 [Trichophaea hybrida]